MSYRTKSAVTISTVSAGVHCGAEAAHGAAPKDAKVWLTPFEIRWQ